MDITTNLINPYWDAIKGDLQEDDWRGNLVVGYTMSLEAFQRLNRQEFVVKYSWSIPDPDSLAFVFEYCKGRIIDPMAGTGYWGYLLDQMGVDVLCYDKAAGKENNYKSETEHFPVMESDCRYSVVAHSDRTLFLSWPPYNSSAGYDALSNYEGSRVIYIGEGEWGCTGDDSFHELLENDWTEIDHWVPVQWWGLHDCITVYDRKTECILL